ncbi:MAG: hypothetical protein U1F11_09210 [Steroidobacteraceae bacterium]
MSDAPRLLLVPVSGPRGMGEYARCLAVAAAVRGRWPRAEPHLLVSREAPYAASCPFPATLLPSSATRCTREVLEAFARWRPHVVWFDNAGRTRQVQGAHAAGAGVVFVSSRSRQRRKAFRLRWMRAIDEHWISYPAALTGGLGPLERLKLRLLGRPALRFLDAVVAPPDEADAQRLLGAAAAPDVVVVPGGGSTYPDARISPQHFLDWSLALAAQGRRVIVVGGPSFAAPAAVAERLTFLRGVPGGTLMALLLRARLVLVNGGDTLAQALALGCACVAVPIAGDQAGRIARAAALGVLEAPAPAAVVERCAALLADDAARAALRARLAALGWRDATPLILERLAALFDAAAQRAPGRRAISSS